MKWRRAQSRPSRARGLKRLSDNCKAYYQHVAPLAGAWIETARNRTRKAAHRRSRPSRARGLKLLTKRETITKLEVAPLAGAWIETESSGSINSHSTVAPLAGAWIETASFAPKTLLTPSRPSRARGLKLFRQNHAAHLNAVAPLAGAWIETHGLYAIRAPPSSRPSRARGLKPTEAESQAQNNSCRAPRGRVD